MKMGKYHFHFTEVGTKAPIDEASPTACTASLGQIQSYNPCLLTPESDFRTTWGRSAANSRALAAARDSNSFALDISGGAGPGWIPV